MIEPNIEIGKSLLELLDDKGVNPTAFLWIYIHDSNSWRLIISSRTYDDDNMEVNYGSFIDHFGADNLVKQIGLSNITILLQKDGFLNLLKSAIVTDNTTNGIRLTSSTISGTFIEDVYIYRLTR